MVPIILQCYNRLSYTMQTISSIKNNILHPNKIIVVDNFSTDGTREYLQFCKEKGIIDYLILNNKNEGISVPKNQGLEVVKELAKTEDIRYVMISDNDITMPFVRDKQGKCCLSHIVEMMNNHPEVGMCGIDLDKQNAPDNQAWWWKLRQHPATNPEFTEISIGFWGAVIRYEFFNEFSFIGESLYGRVDEALRNWCFLVKKQKIGLWKGVYDISKKETIPCLGQHLGWREDLEKYPDYVNFKKQERYKAEVAWREKNRKW